MATKHLMLFSSVFRFLGIRDSGAVQAENSISPIRLPYLITIILQLRYTLLSDKKDIIKSMWCDNILNNKHPLIWQDHIHQHNLPTMIIWLIIIDVLK